MRFLVEYFGARRLSPKMKQYIHEIETVADSAGRRPRKQRIKMNGQFDAWNRRLRSETAGKTPNDEDAPASTEALP